MNLKKSLRNSQKIEILEKKSLFFLDSFCVKRRDIITFKKPFSQQWSKFYLRKEKKKPLGVLDNIKRMLLSMSKNPQVAISLNLDFLLFLFLKKTSRERKFYFFLFGKGNYFEFIIKRISVVVSFTLFILNLPPYFKFFLIILIE